MKNHFTAKLLSHSFDDVKYSHLFCVILLGFPSKEDDSLLVRTPDLAVPMEDDLTLQGHGYFGKYAPLTSRNVAQILENE